MSHPIDHPIEITAHLDREKGKWIIRVKGVTSGVRIHGGDGDNMSVEFGLDASRFTPRVIRS